jgi:uncharacterized membrane protein
MNRLLHGLPGHPLHPPLTDATIGMYTFAAAMAVISRIGWITEPAAHAAWLGLIAGLIVTVPTALAGFVDWLTLEWSSSMWRTATAHLLAMVTATGLFALAAWQDHAGYNAGNVTGWGLVLTLLGFGCLTLGGWLGGSVVFVHGMRVLHLPEAPARRAASPTTTEAER